MSWTMKSACLIVWFLAASALYGAVIYVPDDYGSIQGAINAAPADAVVIVRPGVYKENIVFQGRPVLVRGEQGHEVTVIDGRQLGSVVTFSSLEGADTVLDGFTITNGLADDGGGILCADASPTIIECVVTNNAAAEGEEGSYGNPGGVGGHGGGLYASSASDPTVTACFFYENHAGDGGTGVDSDGGKGGSGGGIYCASATIADSLFATNKAGEGGSGEGGDGADGGHGGGIFCGAVQITNCFFCGNSAGSGGDDAFNDGNDAGNGGRGGGIYCNSASTFDGCVFFRNASGDGGYSEWGAGSGGEGGGLCLLSGPSEIIKCEFRENSSGRGTASMDWAGAGGSGGGLFAGTSSIEITECVFVGNWTGDGGDGDGANGGGIAGLGGDGGGVCCFGGTITRCTLIGNRAGDGGDADLYAIAARGGHGGAIKSTGAGIENCLIVGNSAGNGGNAQDNDGGNGGCGGGIHNSDGLVINSTVFRNATGAGGTTWGGNPGTDGTGGGLFCTTATVVNSIVWDNDQDQISGTPTVSHSDVESGSLEPWWDPANCLEIDPFFADPDNDDFHLTADSPCRGTGDEFAAGLPAEDFEGDPRSALDGPDMGCDEFYYHLYHVGQVAPGESVTIKIVGEPTSPVYLLCGDAVLEEPLETAYGDLYLELPLLRWWYLGAISPDGIFELPVTVPLHWVPGEVHPFQAFVSGAGGLPSRLTNLMAAEVEY